MAVELLAASSEHYYRSASLSGDVFTFAAWVYLTDLSVDRTIIAAGDEAQTNNNYFQLRYDQSSNDLRFVTRDATTNGIALSTITPAANTWYHVVGSISALNSRSVWVNGGNKGTNTTTLTSWSSTIDNIAVGAYRDASPGVYMNGRVFMPTVWQGWAAGDEDVLAMAAGVPPWKFAPDKLIFFTPLASADGTPRDWVSGTALTVSGTPTTAEGPHVMSDGGILVPASTAAADVGPLNSPRVLEGFLASGATGTKDFTIDGIGTIGGAIVYTNRASATNDPALAEGDTTWICAGFWDGTTQVSYAHHSEDGLTTPSFTDCWNAYSANKIAYWCNNAGTTQFAATISSITDGVRITTNTSDGEAHRCMVILFPSSIISSIDCQVIDRSGIDANGVVEVTNVGFEADAVFVLAGRCTAAETPTQDFCHSFGFALNTPGEPNWCMDIIEDDGRDLATTTTYLSNISNEVHCAMNNAIGLRWGLQIKNFDAQGFTTRAWNEYVEPLSTNDTNPEDILALAIKFPPDTNFAGYMATAPTAAGDWAQRIPPRVVDTVSFGDASVGTSSSDTHGFDLVEGDVIIACVSLNADSVTITDNNGINAFTPISARVDGTTCSHRCFYWVVDDTTDTAFDWTYGSSVGRGSRVYAQVRGVDPNDVISGTVTTGTGGSVGAAGAVDRFGALAMSFATDDVVSTAADDLQWNSDYYEYHETNDTVGQEAGFAVRAVESGAPPAHTVTGVGGAGVHSHFALNAAPGFAPQFGLIFGSEGVPDISSGDASNAESFSVMPFDRSAMRSFGYNSADNVATVTTSAYSLSGWRQVENNGVPGTDDTFVGTHQHFDTEGFTMNFTSVSGTRDRWPVFLLGSVQPTYIGHKGASGSSVATMSVTHGMDIRDGDLIIACVNSNLNPTTITSNSTDYPFTELPNFPKVGSTSTVSMFYRIAGPSEPSSYGFDHTNGPERLGVGIIVYRDVSRLRPFNITPDATNMVIDTDANFDGTCTAITPTADALGVAVATIDNGSGGHWTSIDNNFAFRDDDDFSGINVVAWGDKPLIAASSGATVFTGTSSSDRYSLQFALNPRTMEGDFIKGATSQIASGTSVTVTHGMDLRVGDVLIAFVHHGEAGTISCTNNEMTSKFQEENPSTSTSQIAFFEHVVDGTEPTTFTFTTGAIANRFVAHLLQFRGIDNNSIWDVPPSASAREFVSAGTSLGAPVALTTNYDHTIGLACVTGDENAFTFSGHTAGYDNETEIGIGQAMACVSQRYTTAGAKTAYNCTMSGSGDMVGYHIALRVQGQGVIVTDVDTDESWTDGDTGLIITGTGFIEAV